MAKRPVKLSILRPLAVTILAFLLALAFERFSFPSISYTLSPGTVPYRLVYSELQGSKSTIWAADPAEPAGKPKSLLTINHQMGYGISASLSPDGERIAYAILPTGRRDPFSEGQLWVAGADGRNLRLVSNKVDLHITPLWSPTGKEVLFKLVEDLPAQASAEQAASGKRKAEEAVPGYAVRSRLMVASVDWPAASRAVAFAEEADLFPIGWTSDGSGIYYRSFGANGTELYLVALQTLTVDGLGKLADGLVGSLRLSPDSRKLAFVTSQIDESGITGAVWQLDFTTGQASALAPAQRGPIAAIWHPSGASVTRNGAPTAGKPGLSLFNTSAVDGIDSLLRDEVDSITSIPVSWSPDASFLAVRKRSIQQSGAIDSLAIFDSKTGGVKEIKGGYAEVVGWINTAK